MTFQAYLDNIEEKTGLTPRQFLRLAADKGFGAGTKATPIIEWLAADFGLGRGHAMALVHVIQRGGQISEKHVDTDTTHSDPSSTLWLDGKASKPATTAG